MSIVHLKGREPPKSARSAMDTLLFTREEIKVWKLPPFQRPLRINSKVLALAESIKIDKGCIPGVLTLGRLGNDRTFYIVDGQHRLEGFKISELPECIADVRIIHFESMADMAEEFVNLNSRLVNMRPDDILRGLEESSPPLRRIRQACSFVSYGQIRRGNSNSPVIGMSQLLRSWHMSQPEQPSSNAPSATALAAAMDIENAERLISFMTVTRAAWGFDQENYRLWGTLNLTITMWLWRKLVLEKTRGVKRFVVMTPDQFKKCLMSASADQAYLDWLVGRPWNQRDMAPCFSRLKIIFAKRLQQEVGDKVTMPQPSWVSR